MKPHPSYPMIAAVCCAVLLLSPTPRATAQGDPEFRTQVFAQAQSSGPRNASPADGPADPGEANLRLNFRGVPLDMVLEYLSEAAGFIIIKETDVKGTVDAWSNQPLTRDEAVELLNTVLNKNEYAAIRNGRTLTIVARDEAKKRDIPIQKGGNADAIPKTDQMVTQIIPVRHANISQLMTNLQPLIGTYATMTINESANALIVTATQADVRRMTEIVNALDESIADTSSIRVFPLRHADAKELANVIKELFPANQGSARGVGGGGGGGGVFPGGFQGGGNQGGGGGFPGGFSPNMIREALQGRGAGGQRQSD